MTHIVIDCACMSLKIDVHYIVGKTIRGELPLIVFYFVQEGRVSQDGKIISETTAVCRRISY